MSLSFEVNAELRRDLGKGASRRLRRTEKIPAVLYGGGGEAVPLVLDHSKLLHNLEHEAFYTHILSLNVEGKTERAVLKDLQRHPYKPKILHVDFQRVTDTTRIRMSVPLHFRGEDVAPGVKKSGGIVNHLLTNVEVICLAKDLPEYIEVDLSALEAGSSVHLSDLKMPDGVRVAALLQGPDHDLPVATIVVPRAAMEEGSAESGGESAS